MASRLLIVECDDEGQITTRETLRRTSRPEPPRIARGAECDQSPESQARFEEIARQEQQRFEQQQQLQIEAREINQQILLERARTQAQESPVAWQRCWLNSGTTRSWRSWCVTPNAGDTQENPFLPDIVSDSGEWWFDRVPSGQWYDPPTTFGFGYEMAPGSLFTSILDFPTGFDSPFSVSIGDTLLGQFSPGQSVDFVDLLGEGVSHFAVTGISPTVDTDDPTAFPIKLDFSTEYASFRMYSRRRFS